MKDRPSEKARLAAICAEGQLVVDKIWQSERTIERFRERLKRLDERLAAARKTQRRE